MTNIRLVSRVPTVDEYNSTRVAAGLSEKDTTAAQLGLKNSLCAVCAYSDSSLIGIGRVIGDGGIYFQIVDLAVLPSHQGKGVGKSILKELMAYVHANAKAGSFISLFSNKGLAEYYRKFGFDVRDSESPGMSFRIPPVK